MKNPIESELTVLYVEDDAFTSAVITMLLKKWVKQLFIAKDGREGLEVYKKIKPNVVITDNVMPYMTGLDLAAEIRKIDKEVFIYMVTTHEDEEFLKKAEEIGIDRCIEKPLSKDKIQSVLEAVAFQNRRR